MGDMSIILSSGIDLVLQLQASEYNFAVVRALRCFRALRLFRRFPYLRLLVEAIFHVMRPLFWACVTLTILTIIFSVVFLEYIPDYVIDNPEAETLAPLQRYF